MGRNELRNSTPRAALRPAPDLPRRESRCGSRARGTGTHPALRARAASLRGLELRDSRALSRAQDWQTSALPLGYGAVSLKLASYLDFLNPPSEVLPTSSKPLSCCTRRVKNGRDCWPS